MSDDEKKVTTKRTTKAPREEAAAREVQLNAFVLQIMPEGAAVPLPPVQVFSDETFAELVTRITSKGRHLIAFPATVGLGIELVDGLETDTIPYVAFRASTIYGVGVAMEDEDEDDDDDEGGDEPIAKVLPKAVAAPKASVVPEGFALQH